jgi:hypothetical protein
MSRRRFTYTVLRYTHDPSAGESMNVGVLVYSPDAAFVDVEVMFQYQRLSDAFAGFDGEGYRKALRSLVEAVQMLRDEFFNTLVAVELPDNARDVVLRIWPDQQLSLSAGPPMTGMSEDLSGTQRRLYERFVTSQYERLRDERRSDDEVWESFRVKLQGTVVPQALTPVRVETNNLSASFYGFRNERWHLFQPISLDYAREASIKRKAKEFLGEFVELSDSEIVQASKIYLLLGVPTHKQFQAAYESAKNMLQKIPVNHQLVEESDAHLFAAEMDQILRNHPSESGRLL